MTELNQNIINKLSDCNSIEEAVKLFADNGIDISKDDLIKAMDKYSKTELTDDDLDNVVGGFGLVDSLAQYLAKIAKGKIINLLNNKDED